MSDIIDDANDTADHFLAVALRNSKHTPIMPPFGDGSCMQCGAEITPERRWCDAKCRDEWQKGNPA